MKSSARWSLLPFIAGLAGLPACVTPERDGGPYDSNTAAYEYRQRGRLAQGQPAPLGAPALAQQASEDAFLERRLDAVRVSGLVVRDEESLQAVVRALQTASGLPMVVSNQAEVAAIDAGVVFELNLRNPISVRSALNIVTDMAGDEVTWIVRHAAVIVTTKDRARGPTIVRAHDVRTLTFGLTDFRAPRIRRLRLIDELEDDDGGGPFGGVGERVSRLEEDEIVTLVQENVAPGTWDGAGISISAENGLLIVVHTPAVQARVAAFLQALAGI